MVILKAAAIIMGWYFMGVLVSFWEYKDKEAPSSLESCSVILLWPIVLVRKILEKAI